MEGWLDIAFSQVLENTIAGAVLGSIFLLVVSLNRRALPALSYSLAVLVLVRLAFPIVPEIGVGNLLEWEKAPEMNQDSYLADNVTPPQAEFEQLVLSDLFEGVTQEGSELTGEQFFAAERNVNFAIPWGAIWLTGMLLLLLCVFVRQIRFAVRMHRRSQAVEGFTTRKNSMLGAAVASPMFRQKSEIKQRIVMIQNPRALSPLQLAVILPAFCGIALFTFPTAADEKDKDEARRGGDRPSPEYAEKRGGDRPGPEAEGRKAPDRPSPEREVRRDGDRPSPEREVRRDGDREHPEREVRRDGGREHPEREMHRDSRLHHLRTAAENLERAGLHEDARRYHEQAERLQAEMIRRHIPEAQHHRAEQLEREVRELRAVVGHLQREIAELHEQLRRKRD